MHYFVKELPPNEEAFILLVSGRLLTCVVIFLVSFFFFLEHMVISCTSAITQTKVEHMWRLLAGSYFPTRRREREREREGKKGKSKSKNEISRHPSRGGCHFSSLPLFLTLFSSYCSRWGDFSFSSSDAIKECTVISPAQPQQNKELQ